MSYSPYGAQVTIIPPAALFLFIALYIGFRVLLGMISHSIAEHRQMNGGFSWGFFLGILGMIVVAVRPNDELKRELLNTQKSISASLDAIASALNRSGDNDQNG